MAETPPPPPPFPFPPHSWTPRLCQVAPAALFFVVLVWSWPDCLGLNNNKAKNPRKLNQEEDEGEAQKEGDTSVALELLKRKLGQEGCWTVNLLPQTNQGGPAKAEWELLTERRSVLIVSQPLALLWFLTVWWFHSFLGLFINRQVMLWTWVHLLLGTFRHKYFTFLFDFSIRTHWNKNLSLELSDFTKQTESSWSTISDKSQSRPEKILLKQADLSLLRRPDRGTSRVCL